MTFLEKILYEKNQKDNQDLIIVNGVSYEEMPSLFDSFTSLFSKKKKIVRIVYKKGSDKND